MYNTLKAFLLGMREFRSDVTTMVDYENVVAYERGRELAHCLTLRRFDQ